MVKKIKTWIVVADGSHARIYERVARGNTLATVLERDDPEARKRTSDLVSDAPGRGSGGGQGARHAMNANADAHRHLEQQFVRNLAREIEHAPNKEKFDRLILVMPPKALGEMRAALSQSTRDRVVAEFHRELVSLSAKDLLAYIDEYTP